MALVLCLSLTVVSYAAVDNDVLSSSLDTSGAVYNGTGYKADVRWSQSSSSEIDATGYYLTGWISVSQGDVLKFNDIVFDNGSNSYCALLVSDTLGSVDACYRADTLPSFVSAQWDGSGHLTYLTWNSDTSYVRFVLSGCDSSSSIVVDQPMNVPTLLSRVRSVFNSAIGMVGAVATTITSNPILLLFAIVPLCGIGIGFFKRLISIR